MKWLAVYMAIINGHKAILNDTDGPTQFRRFMACRGHAEWTARQMGVIMRDKFIGLDIEVFFRCERVP